MKNKLVKRVFAVLLTLGIVVSSMAMAFALDLDDLSASNLIPHGSNPVSSDDSKNSSSDSKSDSSSDNKSNSSPTDKVSDAVDAIKDALFTPTAPSQVKEAFSAADADYAKDHEYCFAVNTSQNIVIAYQQDEDGNFTKPVKAFVCSCGLATSPTKTGVFTTTDRYMWRALNGGVWGQYATRITGSYLFHSVPYEKKDKSTLETEEYNKLGENASAGCVRLAAHDAKWIMNRCPEGTIVYIYEGSNVREPLAKPEAQKIDLSSPYAGWDPTDPSENNPWKNA